MDKSLHDLVENYAKMTRKNATQAAEKYKTLATYGKWTRLCTMWLKITPQLRGQNATQAADLYKTLTLATYGSWTNLCAIWLQKRRKLYKTLTN